MNSTPQIQGYQFDQRLLEHPLAEVWRGRTFTGMEVVALVLSDAGAADPRVRDRLSEAGRDAALEPGAQQTPLWAANLSTDRPYAITQLVPGQSGAERLIDPLDGHLGNDEESLQAVRSQLSQYGAMPPTILQYAETPGGPTKIEVVRQYRRKLGAWSYLVAALIVLVVFTVAYSVGAAVGSSVKDDAATEETQTAAVSPDPLPTLVLLPGIPFVKNATYKRPDAGAGLFGATYPAGADVQVVSKLGLPFTFSWPRPPIAASLGETSSVLYRRVLTASAYQGRTSGTLDARLAVHPCKDLAGCLADRATFDQQWTKVLTAPVPATAKDRQTWLTVRSKSYMVTMTRAYSSGGHWWLVGAAVTGAHGEEDDVQRILNDIWLQTT